jgi:hypothetical protein
MNRFRMTDGIGGLHADALRRVVEHQELIGREWQKRVGAPALIGKLDLAHAIIVEHDDRASVATPQEHGLATLEVHGPRVFKQGHSRMQRRQITYGLDYRAGRTGPGVGHWKAEALADDKEHVLPQRADESKPKPGYVAR